MMNSRQRTRDNCPAPPLGAPVWIINHQGVITSCKLDSLLVEPDSEYKGQEYTYCYLKARTPNEFPKFGTPLNQIYIHQEAALKDALKSLEHTRNYFRNLKAEYKDLLKKCELPKS